MKKTGVIRESRGDRVFNGINIALMIVLMIVMLYPIYFTVIASISDPFSVVNGEVFVIPKGFTLEAYKNVFQEPRIWTGYRNTLIYTALGTVFSLLLTMTSAYVLSKKYLPGRGFLGTVFLVVMYFSGGLIPTYLQVKSLGLLNQPYTLIILGSLSVYNVIVTRVYYQTSIPEELYESAYVDGAGELYSFIKIALPLSAPIMAVMALFYGVARWNEYFNALIYVTNSEYYPLQLVMRGILLLNQNAFAGMEYMEGEALLDAARQKYIAYAMKYALIFVSSAPLLIAYPFVQKYFIKGMLIGSIKG